MIKCHCEIFPHFLCEVLKLMELISIQGGDQMVLLLEMSVIISSDNPTETPIKQPSPSSVAAPCLSDHPLTEFISSCLTFAWRSLVSYRWSVMTYEVPSMSKHSAAVKDDSALDSPLQVNRTSRAVTDGPQGFLPRQAWWKGFRKSPTTVRLRPAAASRNCFEGFSRLVGERWIFLTLRFCFCRSCCIF